MRERGDALRCDASGKKPKPMNVLPLSFSNHWPQPFSSNSFVF
jgi:hypothetical protein